jgi:hypothetical protein
VHTGLRPLTKIVRQHIHNLHPPAEPRSSRCGNSTSRVHLRSRRKKIGAVSERVSVKLDAGEFQSVGLEFLRQGDYSVSAIDVPPVKDHIQGERPPRGSNESSSREFVSVYRRTRQSITRPRIVGLKADLHAVQSGCFQFLRAPWGESDTARDQVRVHPCPPRCLE